MSGLMGPSPPAAPNPYQVSSAQTQSNVQTGIANQRMNNVNQVTPYGTVNYQYQPSGVKVQGQNIPSATQTTTLNPQQQAILNQQQGLTLQTGGLASNLENAVPTTAMNFNNAPGMPSVNAVTPGAMPNPNNLPTPGAMPTLQAQPQVGKVAQDAINATYQQQQQMLDPQWAQQEKQLHDSLQDQGIPPGSEAYNNAVTLFNNQKQTAYGQARDAAIQEGYNVANQQFGQGLAANQQGYEQGMGQQQNAFGQGMERATTQFGQGMQAQGQQFGQNLQANQNLFGQGLQARQQGVGETSQLYNQPIQTLGALMSAYGGGNVQAPQASPYPSAVQPTDVTGAFGLAQAGNLAAYKGNVDQYSANVGGISSILGDAALAGYFK